LKLLTQIEEEFREIPHYHKPSEFYDGEANEFTETRRSLSSLIPFKIIRKNLCKSNLFIPISWLIVGQFIRCKMHYDPCSSLNEGKEKRKKFNFET
jgi:hypothetical protein